MTPAQFDSLTDVVRFRADRHPDERAFVFLSDRGVEQARLTFGELETRARAVAALLAGQLQPGDRALLVFAPGLEFIEAFFGCLMAGIIAVPMMVPRRASQQDSGMAIVADCGARLALTTRDLAAVRPDVIERFREAGVAWLLLGPDWAAAPAATPFPDRGHGDIAFLQYTSGSTSTPKGVMVSHGNLLDNLEMIRGRLGNTSASTYVSWVPLYHDMGLILNVLQSHFVGALCVLTAPVSFVQRPLGWLRAIHTYRAQVTTAPNFAFDLCVSRFRPDQMDGIDLSCWKVAINAAEPVNAQTIARFVTTFRPYGFDPAAMSPLYGLAEATLLVSAGERGSGAVTRTLSREGLQHHRVEEPSNPEDACALVGCGPGVPGERIAIVDSRTRRRLGTKQIGEIWVAGPHVARGYWGTAEATAATFHATIAGEDDTSWLRTGDLGMLDDSGELYITGRIKDVIIIRGINYYPQDIEAAAQNSHPALRRHCAAAFTVPDEPDGERLILVQEIERTARHAVSAEEIAGHIREAVFKDFEIAVHQVLLLSPGTLPKTTSGKVQRSLARKLWQGGQLKAMDQAGTS